ncbi:MAG: metal ABC transporter ATP-binding protein [Candidatus Woesearchaeota archaeon]
MRKQENLIEVKNLNFNYGETIVLQNINFEVKRGDFLGLIGPNGSGKTTLLRTILGLNKTQKGKITILGRDITQFKEWQKIGYVSQKATNIDQTFPATVDEIISTATTKKITNQQIQEVLKIVKMQQYTKQKIGELSGGEQQRVFIARALLKKPELLILDEPTTGIDKESKDNFYELLNKLNKKGITIILVSHDTGIITKYVNKVACINKTLHFHGTHKEFCAHEEGQTLEKYHLINHEH